MQPVESIRLGVRLLGSMRVLGPSITPEKKSCSANRMQRVFFGIFGVGERALNFIPSRRVTEYLTRILSNSPESNNLTDELPSIWITVLSCTTCRKQARCTSMKAQNRYACARLDCVWSCFVLKSSNDSGIESVVAVVPKCFPGSRNGKRVSRHCIHDGA